VATSEPVVLHHGRQEDDAGGNEVRPSVFNGLLGGARPKRREACICAFRGSVSSAYDLGGHPLGLW
jgi:hypothetical protein